MRGGNPNSTENNRAKQGMSVHTPATRLLGAGTQTPEKYRHRRTFSSPLTRRLRVLPDAVSILLSRRSSLSRIQRPQGRVAAPPVERLARQQSGPCWGIGDLPDKRIFGENRKCICTCPACRYCFSRNVLFQPVTIYIIFLEAIDLFMWVNYNIVNLHELIKTEVVP